MFFESAMRSLVQDDVPNILNAFSLALLCNLPQAKDISKRALLVAVRKTQKEITLPTVEELFLNPQSSTYVESFVHRAKAEIEQNPATIAAINACVHTMNNGQASLHDILKAFKELHFITKKSRKSVLSYCGKSLKPEGKVSGRTASCEQMVSNLKGARSNLFPA